MVDNVQTRGRIARMLSGAGCMAIACAGSLLMAGVTGAAPVEVNFTQDPVLESGFVLDFGFPGGVSAADVSDTEFDLEIDPASGTARFTRYSQLIAPLILQGPDGPVSTGDITVEILASLGGTFDRETGQFVTNDIYAVHFTGDLSIFGITSPFVLPSSSTATIEYTDIAEGVTELVWDGGSELGGFAFTYQCQVKGIFQSSNTAAYVAASTPTHNSVDARQPHEVLDASSLQGTQTVDVRFNSPTVAGMTSSELIVTEWGDDSIAPTIDSVETISTDTVRIQLSQPIAPGAWTVITHLPSGTSVCLGSLPGDVNGDGVAAPSDILAVIDCLNGTAGQGCGDAQVDVDRSGEAGPSDILRVIDLLNGAGAFDAWLNATLGPSPCAN